MTLSAVLKWRNDDSTADMNKRFGGLFDRGVLTGGAVTPVTGQLSVAVESFTCMSNDGMLVEDTQSATITVPLDQTSVIALRAKHLIGAPPDLELVVIEVSVFNGLINRADHVVFATVTKSSPAVDFLVTDISYATREEQDKRGRDAFRGRLAYAIDLPADPNTIKPGDIWVVTEGIGDAPTLYSWNGINWVDITSIGSLATDLAQHRANLFTNEIHLTDSQADAALGSSGSPSAVNRYVTELDTRLPTQNENDALLGSDGSPSNANRYITAEYAIAEPTQLIFPVGGSIIVVPVVDSPAFVGTGGVGSANNMFALLGLTDLGYVNLAEEAVNVNGLFLDPFLSIPLDPSTDVNVDADGFFTGDLYVSCDGPVDSYSRLIYGKRKVLQTVGRNVVMLPTPATTIVPGLAIERIANIKGRAFADPTPTREQNINLRSDLDDVGSYLGTVLETNVVAANDDFVRLSQDPIYGPSFVKNVGVSLVYTFSNTGLVSFSYAVGVVTFASPVNLSGVRIGDLFRDGAGNLYNVTAVNDPADTLGIVSAVTGLIPNAIVTSVGTAPDGSTQINFNPRNLLLSEMKLSFGAEHIKVATLVSISNEFSVPGGQVALGVVNADGRFDPRVVFYGAWENYRSPTRQKYVRNDGANGSIMLTGFFTSVAILLRRKPNSPPLGVSIDGQAAVTVSTSAIGAISANVANDEGPKYQRVVLASGLPPNRPTTLTISILSNTVGTLDVFGIEMVRDNSDSLALLESGRAFQEARILKRDTIDDSVPISAIGALSRGGQSSYYLAEQSYGVSFGELTDLDAGGTPSGNATGAVVTITAGAGKLTNYKVNDIILVANVTTSVIRRISVLALPVITLDSATSYAGDAVTLRHIASTGSPAPNLEEELLTRYSLLTDFADASGTDLSKPDLADRMVVSRDGLTLISGKAISVGVSGIADITGVAKAVIVDTAFGSDIRFCVTSTRLDLIINSASAVTFNISVDGSPNFSETLAAGSARRYSVFSNARYQSHEVVITPTSGALALSEIMLFLPIDPVVPGTTTSTADLGRIAAYEASRSGFTSAPFLYPLGGVFYPSTHHMSYLTGTPVAEAIGVSQPGTSNTPVEFSPLRLRGNTFLTPTLGSSALSSVTVDIIKQAGEISAAQVVCKIWNTAAGVPTSTVATSTNTVAASSLSTSYGTPSAFTFAGVNLSPSTTYAWTVEVTSATTNQLLVRLDSANPYANGQAVVSDNGGTSFSVVAGSDNAKWTVNLVANADWQVILNYAKTPYYKYIASGNQDAEMEFYFLGSAFELQYITGPDHGIFKVSVDSVQLQSVVSATIVGTYTGNQVDAYSASYSRRNIGAYGFAFGYHKVTAKIENPRTKNVSSSGYAMAFTGIYVCNYSRTLTLSFNQGIYSSLNDTRKFNAVDLTPAASTTDATNVGFFASGVRDLTIGTTSQAVLFDEPYIDASYIVMCNIRNSVDAYPAYQSVVITVQTLSGFTVAWNAPLPTSNYELVFIARSLIG